MNMWQDNSGDALYAKGRAVDISAFMTRVYSWMAIGILVTGVISYYIGSNPEWVKQVFSNQAFLWTVIIAQLGAVIFLSFMINRISAGAATITFLMYSALTGITMSAIFVTYTQASIASAFATTAIGFAGLSLFGYITKRDLGRLGLFCVMGLFGLLGFMVLSFFIPSLASDNMQIVFSIAGLVIFAGLTAYDSQRIKAMASSSAQNMGQMAIYGALILYLDFINLFINLLRLTGDRE